MTRLEDARCPGCSTGYDRHTSVVLPGSTPSPGDVSVCPYCAHVSTYTDDLLLETAPAEIRSAPEVARAVDAVRAHLGRPRDAIRAARRPDLS